IADEPRFQLDDSEAKSMLPSYTVETLERLRKQLGPDRPLVLLLGADAFHGLPGWHRWEDILRLAHIAVATRPGYPLAGLTGVLADLLNRCRITSAEFSNAPAGGIHAFELSAGTVSATEVRKLVAAGAPDTKLLELLPPAVLDYIRRHHLYHD
ncbi:MAG: nicotinate-nicotinamide nucleotide adenylyltransferase, partial [Rhodocyclaceae bacterium]